MNRRESVKAIALSIFAPKAFLKPSQLDSVRLSTGTGYNPNETIWFNYPGKYWNSQAMHIGNGFLGLSFLGGTEEEIFGITEKSVWTGGPGEFKNYNYGIKPGGSDHLAKIRELIVSGEPDSLKEADSLVRKHFTGSDKGYGHFSAFGRLSVIFGHTAKEVKNYTRSLDMATAISKIQYEYKGILFKREYFCSYPDRVAVLKFAAGSPGQLSFRMKWKVFQQQYRISFNDNLYEVAGKINGNDRDFCLKMQLSNKTGTIVLDGQDLVINQATEVTIILSGATAYTPVAPMYSGADPFKITAANVAGASNKTPAQLKQNHIKDYQQLYNRVKLKVGGSKTELLPTNLRWNNYAQDQNDPSFKVLYFNLSRYLLISSSRPGSLPANLQGAWNVTEAAQWSGNYQSNINVQLNYSSACAVNLAECQVPYINWIKGLVKPGTAVAKAYYHSEGWVSHSIGNVWGYAAPGFEIEWGMYPAGAAWHCHYIWQHYIYTQDKDYLQKTAYPVMKGAATFWLQNLINYKGYLITAPSGSAEHGVYLRNLEMVATGSSYDADIINVPCNFQDIQMVYDLFANTIKAAETLFVDEVFIAELKSKKDRLMPLKIGKYGQLQEWYTDADTPECNHRHIGHLYALWPARQISVTDTALANAARKTLMLRGEERNYKDIAHKDKFTAANWSLGLRMACWLRLHNAEHANKLLTQIITTAGFENLMTYQQIPATDTSVTDQQLIKTNEGNYWMPVWQIDTSLAMAGFIAEMLLQVDNDGTLLLLPALPGEWATGEIRGLRAPGGFTVDMVWKNSKIIKYSVYGVIYGQVRVKVNEADSLINVIVR